MLTRDALRVQAEPDVAAPSQKACEIVEEAAAEAGLIKEDTARLVKVLSPCLSMYVLAQRCNIPAPCAKDATELEVQVALCNFTV